MPTQRFDAQELFAGGGPPSTIGRMISDSLSRFAHLVREVQFVMRDENGPKGGVDMKCRLELRLLPRGVLVVHGVGQSGRGALQEACERLRASLVKRIKTRRTKSRSVMKEKLV